MRSQTRSPGFLLLEVLKAILMLPGWGLPQRRGLSPGRMSWPRIDDDQDLGP